MNGYELSRSWFNFCFENPEKINPNHSALFFFCVEHCNRLGWKEKFGLPTTMAKEAIGIRSYNTYIKTLNELVDFGFIVLVEKSKNQYSSNIVALSNFNKALDNALDKALIKHTTKQGESTRQSIDSIIKQINNKQLTIDECKQLKETVDDFLLKNDSDMQEIKTRAQKFVDYCNEHIKVNGRTRQWKLNGKIESQFKARVKEGYKFENFALAITNAKKVDHHRENGYQYLTPEFFTRSETLTKYGC